MYLHLITDPDPQPSKEKQDSSMNKVTENSHSGDSRSNYYYCGLLSH